MRMYLRFVEICIQCSPSCVLLAAALRSESASVAVACSAFSISVGYVGSCMPMYAVNLFFYSSNVA